MTDLEITRKCAEAMGYKVGTAEEMGADDDEEEGLIFGVDDISTVMRVGTPYNPLHDDAQCFAMLVKFKLSVCYNGGWCCVKNDDKGMLISGAFHYETLNAAICNCVAGIPK